MKRLVCFAVATAALTALLAPDSNGQAPAIANPKGMAFVDQGRNDARLKGYKTPDGFAIEIVCEEPAVINPVGMTFGPDGTLFVLEWTADDGTAVEYPEKITYRDGSTRTIATMKKKNKDIVKALSWNAEKKRFDNPRIILEDELPSSILIHDGWLYLSGRGTVRRWKLADVSNGKNRNAKPEVIARGFCGFHHHQVSGLTIGLDGWLYITSGDDDNHVEGSDGSRATVLRTGAIFRCRPDGSKLHVYSIGFRNPYRDLVQDPLGNWFHIDNDNEEGGRFAGCRLIHVLDEADYGWRLLGGARCCKPDLNRAAANGESPGKMPPMLNTGRGAPAGLLYYDEPQLPAFYRGWLWYPDVLRQSIRAYRLKSAGSTFEVASEFEFLKSTDPRFRPCQMITGPDGAMYISDWRTDSSGAGRLSGDGAHGRIYRVTWSGGPVPGEPEPVDAIASKFAPPAADAPTAIAELAEWLAVDSLTRRRLAQSEFIRLAATKQSGRARSALLRILDPESEYDAPARALSLGALHAYWNDAVRDVVVAALEDAEPAIRRLAADGLALNATPGDNDVQAALLKALSDNDPAVRRAVALAMGRVNAEGAADDLATAYRFDDGMDLFVTDGYLRALERCGQVGIARLAGLAKSGNERDRGKSVAAFLALRTRNAANALPDLLADPHLSVEQRTALIRSHANYQLDPPVSLDPLLDYVVKRPNEPMPVVVAAIETLAEAGMLKGAQAANLLTNLLEAESGQARLSAIRAIESGHIVEAAPRLAQTLADKKRSVDEQLAAIRALGTLGDKSVAGSLKHFALERGDSSLRAQALSALAIIDPETAETIAVRFLDQSDPALLREAIQILGAGPTGARQVARHFLARKIPRDLLPQVSEALRKHGGKHPDLAALLADVMKGGLLVSLNPGEVEKVRQLVLAKGDAHRGKALYLGAKALACVSCHRLEGIGGQIGPDLTRLWETTTIEKMMEALIDPSREIREGFQSFQATTTKGQVFAGLKVIDKPDEVVLRDSTGKNIRLARREIEAISPLKKSLMPDNVISELSFDQFIDLIAFLKSRAAQESLRGMATRFLVIGPFGDDLRKAYGPETDQTLSAEHAGLNERKVKWMSRAAEVNGYLDLRAAFDRDRASAYALTHVYSPRAQSGHVHVGAEDTMRVWLNGELVLEHAAPRPAVPDYDSVRVQWKEGWNRVLIKVSNRLGAHGLFLRVEGNDLRTSDTKD